MICYKIKSTPDLVNEVSGKFDALVKLENLEKVSRETQFNFSDVCRVWIRLPDARKDV